LQNYNYFRDINNLCILIEISEKQLTKLYYTIGEVATMFNVNTSLIRFWEKEFTIIQPKKNKKGNRLFTPKDIINFNNIYNLVKEQGFTLEGAKNALKINNLQNNKTAQIEDKIVSESSIDKTNIIQSLENVKIKLRKLRGL
jgi:DNA-binding transcriptional MerR regulator